MTIAKKHPLIVFFVLAYLISWLFALPLVLQSRGAKLGFPYEMHYLTAYGPMLSAIIVIALTEGKPGLQKYLKRFVKTKGIPKLAWLGAFSLLIIFIGIVTFQYLAGQNVEISRVGGINFLPNFGIGAVFVWLFTSGLGEEGGWRGYALPKLQSKHNALKSSLILAVFWAGWHSFAFFYLPNYSDMGFMIIGFFLGLICGSIFFAWLLNTSKGSILTAIIFHGLLNFTTGSRFSDNLIAPIISTFIMIIAVLLIIKYKPENLSDFPRVRA